MVLTEHPVLPNNTTWSTTNTGIPPAKIVYLENLGAGTQSCAAKTHHQKYHCNTRSSPGGPTLPACPSISPALASTPTPAGENANVGASMLVLLPPPGSLPPSAAGLAGLP